MNGYSKGHYWVRQSSSYGLALCLVLMGAQNLLVRLNGNQAPYLFALSEGDGFLALMTINGRLCLQHVTVHFVMTEFCMAVNSQVRGFAKENILGC